MIEKTGFLDINTLQSSPLPDKKQLLYQTKKGHDKVVKRFFKGGAYFVSATLMGNWYNVGSTHKW